MILVLDGVMISGWIAVAILLVLFRTSTIDWSTMKCRIGVGQVASQFLNIISLKLDTHPHLAQQFPDSSWGY